MIRHIRWLALLLGLHFLSFTPVSASDVFEAIEERQKEYDRAEKSGSEAVVAAFTREILKANQEGKSENVARLSDHLKHFQSSGIMMTAELYSDFIAYGTEMHKARQNLLKAYKDAEKEYVKQLRLDKAEEMAAKAQQLDSRLVSIRLAKRRIDFVQHGDYLGSVKPIQAPAVRMNATFELVAGLADPKAISFRSVNVPNHYIVHGNSRIRLQAFEDVEVFRKNATFIVTKGQGNKSALMFAPINFPQHRIHARERELWIDPLQPTGVFSDRAEFEIVEPQFPFWGQPNAR